MCPHTPPEPNTPPVDTDTVPPELQRLRAAAYELARLRTERALWANTLNALGWTPGKRPELGEPETQNAE